MRADIHDGPEHMLQSEAGYIDARPLTPARQNLLQRTAGPYIRVKAKRLFMWTKLPPSEADIRRIIFRLWTRCSATGDPRKAKPTSRLVGQIRPITKWR